MKDKSWRQEYLGMKVHSQKTRELLENGPKSLSQSWYLQARLLLLRFKMHIRTLLSFYKIKLLYS